MPVLVIDDLKILKPAALRFLKETEGKRIFAFYGAMGPVKQHLSGQYVSNWDRSTL